MNKIKEIVLLEHKYTELVFYRINKKLNLNLEKKDIIKYILFLIKSSKEEDIIKKWKNFYIFNKIDNIRITVNSFTYTIITVDKF